MQNKIAIDIPKKYENNITRSQTHILRYIVSQKRKEKKEKKKRKCQKERKRKMF